MKLKKPKMMSSAKKFKNGNRGIRQMKKARLSSSKILET